MGDFGPWHLAIIAIVFILLFGATRLPDGARSLGRSLRIFKSEIRGMHEDDDAQKSQQQQADQIPAPLPPAPVVTPTAAPTPPAPVVVPDISQQAVSAASAAPQGQPPTNS